MLGAHISFGNPMEYTVKETLNRELETFQVFTRNPRSLKQRYIPQYEIDMFNSSLLRGGLSKYVIHAPYALNPASPNSEKRQTAINIISKDLEFLQHLAGEPLYVLHPGSHMGEGNRNGIDNLISVLEQVPQTRVPICVEVMSGAGTEIMSNIMDLIYYTQKESIPISLTFDTCHAFAAGLHLVGAYKAFKDYIKVVHVNDSQYPKDSFKDRHANIGRGKIPKEFLIDLLEIIPRDVPLILETPTNSMQADIDYLRSVL